MLQEKEEILNQKLGPNFIGDNTTNCVLEAMDQYAEQVNKEALELLRQIYLKNRHDIGLDVDISEFFEKIKIEL